MVHLNSSDLIFLLGAGASKEAGLPLAFDMSRMFIQAVQSRAEDDLIQALCFVLGGLQFRRGYQGLFPSENINIEDVASSLESLQHRHAHVLAPFVGIWNDTLCRFDGSQGGQRDCLSALAASLRQNVKEWLRTPGIGEIRHFSAFRDFVREFGGAIDIFTLNYDLCVERALEYAEIPFTCGFTRQGWHADEFENEVYHVRLYKLHGSLDWYRDDEDQGIYSTRHPAEDRVLVAEPESLLIFGTVNKLQAIDPFLHLCFTFSQRVKDARALAIVGYGFGDAYLNEIIHQGLSRDSRKRLIVVGKDSESAEQALRNGFPDGGAFVDAGRVTFIDGGAKRVLNDGSLLNAAKAVLAEASDEGPFT